MKKLYFIIAALLIVSCEKKAEFLDEKPILSQVTPKSLEDYQALLNDDFRLNGKGSPTNGVVPGLAQIGSDDYIVMETDYLSLSEVFKNYYVWKAEDYGGQNLVEWNGPYHGIFVCNLVLEGIENLTPNENSSEDFNRVKGSALFHRSFIYFNLILTFAPLASGEGYSDMLSIPLRLTTDLDEPIQFSTLKSVYEQIVMDLKLSIDLLPHESPINTRPTVAAAYGLLARVYLAMGDYEEAYFYANRCLSHPHQLLDYNGIDLTKQYPFYDLTNPEVLFNSAMIVQTNSSIDFSKAKVNPDLYALYDENDNRQLAFFITESNGVRFQGSYERNAYFSGVALDEIYLIRAECLARLNKLEDAIQDLKALMNTRYKKDSNGNSYFILPVEVTLEAVLDVILEERRKQLLFRGLRWLDLKRLKDIEVIRKVGNEAITIPRKDGGLYWPIPSYVGSFN